MKLAPRPGDALLVVDVQADFVTGSLAVRDAARIVPVLNRYIARFAARGLPVIATRDWHPPDHASFRGQGGPWPAHCVAGTAGALFADGLVLGPDALVVSKATQRDRDAYSGFDGTELHRVLREAGVTRLFVGGLATDYCVLATVRDALRLGYGVIVLEDAIGAVDAQPGDGAVALGAMLRLGAGTLRFGDLAEPAGTHG